MRILVISNYLYPLEIGGWGQLTHDVGERLRARGHEVRLLTSNHRVEALTQPEPWVDRVLHLESPDREFYHLSYLRNRGKWEAENKRILAEVVTDFAPDVVYVNGMWNLPHSLAQAAERLCPDRVVYYIASYWPTELDAHSAYWQDDEAYGRFPKLKKMAGSIVLKTVVRATPRNQLTFPRVLCVSGFMRDYMVQEAGTQRERTFVVHNGIELDTFTPRSLAFTNPTLRLLYAGRLNWNKGVHNILESLVILRDEQPSLAVSLSILGSGSAHYERRLRWTVNEHGLQECVFFPGRVPREEMPDMLRAHEVFMATSIWPEPLSRGVQEAMACGMVVIGTMTGGTPEILHDGENGLTYSAEDSVTLAHKIALLAQNRALCAKLAQAGRQTVAQHFTMERMVDEVEQHFNEVIG